MEQWDENNIDEIIAVLLALEHGYLNTSITDKCISQQCTNVKSKGIVRCG